MRSILKYVLPFLLFSLCACASHPLPKTLALERPPRVGIIGFEVTAPIKHLSSIMTSPPENLNREEEKALLDEKLRSIEDRAGEFLVQDLEKGTEVEPVPVPEAIYGTERGKPPTPGQMETLRKELGLDAILYGRIPSYGKARLIYPILGETADIAGETVILGLATSWNPALIFGNIGFELLTSTPLWFGGAYIFGWAFRPVTVEVWVLSAEDGKEIWHKSVDKLTSRKALKSYPESERKKKEIQLEVSLHKAIDSISESLRK